MFGDSSTTMRSGQWQSLGDFDSETATGVMTATVMRLYSSSV